MNTDYFKNKKHVLKNVIELLEHVVVILDLFKDEKKLSVMYDFLYSIIRPTDHMNQTLVNILDQWRLKLFRLHIERKIN